MQRMHRPQPRGQMLLQRELTVWKVAPTVFLRAFTLCPDHCWSADGARQAAMKAAAVAATAAAHLTPAQRERAINEAASQVEQSTVVPTATITCLL